MKHRRRRKLSKFQSCMRKALKGKHGGSMKQRFRAAVKKCKHAN